MCSQKSSDWTLASLIPTQRKEPEMSQQMITALNAWRNARIRHDLVAELTADADITRIETEEAA